MVLAGALAVLTMSGRVQVWHVVVLSALLGVVNAFDIPARQAFVVDMVGRGDLVNAIALNSSMFNGARIIGPAVAGVLVAKIGEGWCFFGNAVSYVAVIIGLLAMTVNARAAPVPTSAFRSMMEGFAFVGRNRPIWALMLLLGVVSLTAMPYAVLMPIFADQILHAGASGLGLLMGFSGVGALLGALTLAARKQVRGLGRWVALSSAGFGVSLILFAVSRSFWLSAALLVPVGFSMMVEMASSNTLVQAMVPDGLRGRVMAVYIDDVHGDGPIWGSACGRSRPPAWSPRHRRAWGSSVNRRGWDLWRAAPCIAARGPPDDCRPRDGGWSPFRGGDRGRQCCCAPRRGVRILG